MSEQTISKERTTKETQIQLKLRLAGNQQVEIDTGHGFFNHLLEQLAFHAGWDLKIKATGDLEVDDHHLVEDVAILLGAAIQEAWRSKDQMRRYGQRILPMDETLIMCAVDLCGRPFCDVRLEMQREFVGNLATEMIPHFFHTLAMNGAFNLHLRQMAGKNHHHIVEASFKALARALAEALEGFQGETSTKGSL